MWSTNRAELSHGFFISITVLLILCGCASGQTGVTGVWTLIYSGGVSSTSLDLSTGGPWPGGDVQRSVASFSDFAYVLGGYYATLRGLRWSHSLEKFTHASESWAPRMVQDAITWIDDSAKKLYLFGGDSASSRTSQFNSFYSAVWRSGPADLSFTLLATGPPARSRALSWSDTAGNLWLYGGCSFGGGQTNVLSDIWSYNPGTNTWTNRTATVSTAGPRCSASVARGRGNWVYFFGGTTYSSNYAQAYQLWRVNTETLVFERLSRAAGWNITHSMVSTYNQTGVFHPENEPPARQGSNMWFHNATNCLIVTSGDVYSAPFTSAETWIYSIDLGQWAVLPFGLGFQSAGLRTPGDPVNWPFAGREGSAWMAPFGNNMYFLTGYGYQPEGVKAEVWKLNIALTFSPQQPPAPSTLPSPGVIARYYNGIYSTYTSIEAATPTSTSIDTKGPLMQYDFASGATPMPSVIGSLTVEGRNPFAASFSGYIWNNQSSTLQVSFVAFFDATGWLYVGVDKTNVLSNRQCSVYYGEQCAPWSGATRTGADVYNSGQVDLTPGANFFRFFLSNGDGNQAYVGLWYSANASGTVPTKDRRLLYPQMVSTNPCDSSCLMAEPVPQQSGLLAKFYEYQSIAAKSLFRKNVTAWPDVPGARLVNQPDARYCVSWEGFISVPISSVGFSSTFQVARTCNGVCQTTLTINGVATDFASVTTRSITISQFSSSFLLEHCDTWPGSMTFTINGTGLNGGQLHTFTTQQQSAPPTAPLPPVAPPPIAAPVAPAPIAPPVVPPPMSPPADPPMAPPVGPPQQTPVSPPQQPPQAPPPVGSPPQMPSPLASPPQQPPVADPPQISSPTLPPTAVPIFPPTSPPTQTPAEAPNLPPNVPAGQIPVAAPQTSVPQATGQPASTSIPTSRSSSPEQGSQVTADGLSGGSIVGIVVGIIAAIALAAGLVFFFVIAPKRRKRQQKEAGEELPVIEPDTAATAATTEYVAPPTVEDDALDADFDPKWIIDYSMLELGEKIGSGAFGLVLRGTYSGDPVAIKQCLLNVGPEALDDFKREAKLMLSIKSHPSLVQVYGLCVHKKSIYLVLELCEGGSLDKHMRKEEMTADEKLKILHSIARGVSHLHKQQVVHRDLAARNVLLTENGKAKVSDLGMSRIVDKFTEKHNTTSNVGPIRWMAPESIKSREYSYATDVYSFAIVVIEVWTQEVPFPDEDLISLAIDVRDHGRTPEIPDDVPEWLKDILQRCWSRQPMDRPSMHEIAKAFRDHS